MESSAGFQEQLLKGPSSGLVDLTENRYELSVGASTSDQVPELITHQDFLPSVVKVFAAHSVCFLWVWVERKDSDCLNPRRESQCFYF